MRLALTGELVPNLGAIVLLVLAPNLVIVGEVVDRSGSSSSLVGHILGATIVSIDGHGVGMLLVTKGAITRVRRARTDRAARVRARTRAITRAIIHMMGVIVGAFARLAVLLMATRAVIAILRRAVVASPASTIVTVTIGAMVVAIGAMVVAITIRTTSSTATAGGVFVGATAPLVGTIAGVVGGPLLPLLLVGETLDHVVLDVRSKILREGGLDGGKIFPDVFVRLAVLLLVGERECEEDRFGQLVRIRLWEPTAEQSTREEGELGRSTVEEHFGRHREGATASAEPTDDSIPKILLACYLLEEEGDTEQKLGVREHRFLIVFEVGIDALVVKHLVPLRGCRDTQSKREELKVRWAMRAELVRHFGLSLLGVLVPRVSEKELRGLLVIRRHIEAEVFLLVLGDLQSDRDLDLIRDSRDKVGIQGHLVLATRDFLGVPIEHRVRDGAIEICHDSYGKQKNGAR